MESQTTVRIVFGLVVLLAGTAVATPATGLAATDVDAQSSGYTIEGNEIGSIGDRQTALGWVGTSCRVCHPSETTVGVNDSATTLNVSYTFRRLPDQAGVVGVTMRLPRTPGVDDVPIEFRQDRGITVVGTTNVERNGSTYEWAGDRPGEIVYRLPINWTYTGNSAASWTLVQYRQPSVASIDAGESVDVRRQAQSAGDGYVGSSIVLLGKHDVYERKAQGQRIRVVIPENVTLRNNPRSTASNLATAARSFSIGGRDEVLHAFVTPQIRTEATQLFQPGFAISDNTLLIDAQGEFDVWTHEYVHSRQEFPDTGRLRWLTEGSAEYYGWLLSIEGGYNSWAPLRGVFTRGATDGGVLADPDTWRGETDYNKGALVLGVLDHEIRVATDGERTLQDVIRRINGNDTDPTLETFIEAVRDVGGADAAAAAERYITTSAAPDYRPSSERFVEIYGRSSSSGPNASQRIRTRVLDLSMTGTNGPRVLDPEPGVIEIRPGQTLQLRARVTNVGDAGGLSSFVVRESLNGTESSRIETPWVGWIRSGEAVTRNETLQFSRPGTYEIEWGDRQYTVRVAPDRETASVVGVSATQNRSSAAVVVEATVRNEDDRPTFVEFPVSIGDERVTTIAAIVGENATRTVAVSLNTSQQAPYDVSVGNVRATVGQQQSTSQPGAGAGVPVLAVLSVLAGLALVGGVGWWVVARR